MSESDSTAAPVVSLIGGSHFVNHMYFTLLPPIFGPLQSDLGISTAQSGLALGIVGFVVVALQLPFGYLSDAYSRTLVLGISLGVGAVGAALTATTQSYPWLLLASVVIGIGIAGHHPAHYPMLSAATDPEARGRAYSIHGFTGAIGFAAPFAIVGVIGDWQLALGLIAAFGGLYAVGCLWLVVRRVPDHVKKAPGTTPPERPHLRSLPGRLVQGTLTVFSASAIVLLTLLWFLFSVIAWGIQAYTPTLLVEGYQVAPGTANLVTAAMLGIGAFAILLGGWLADRYGAQAVILGGFGTLVLVASLLATKVLPVVAVLGLTLLLASTVKTGRPALSKLGDSLSTRDDLGKNFGLLTIGISGGGAVAPPVFGALTEYTSIEVVFGAIAGVGVLAFLFTFVVLAAGERAQDQQATARN